MDYAETFSVSTEWILANAMSVLTALIVLVAGWFLAGFLANAVNRSLPNGRRIDETIAPILAQVVRYGVLLITVVIVLSQFGVETASMLAVLGAAGLAIALALQGTLSNIAAGVMLIWLRPFHSGEYIDAEDTAGTVVEIGLFGTRLRTYDGLYVFVPNSQLWDSRITNFSREKTRMVDIAVGVGYQADIGKARTVLLDLAEDERVLPDPAPSVFVSALDASAVTMGLRVWVASSNYWAVKTEFLERAKIELDNAGIEIPYNKLDINILREPNPA
jgi:small conductance mechanosensitive channel